MKSGSLDKSNRRRQMIPSVENLPMSPEAIAQDVDSISSFLDLFGKSSAGLNKVMDMMKGISKVRLSFRIGKALFNCSTCLDPPYCGGCIFRSFWCIPGNRLASSSDMLQSAIEPASRFTDSFCKLRRLSTLTYELLG